MANTSSTLATILSTILSSDLESCVSFFESSSSTSTAPTTNLVPAGFRSASAAVAAANTPAIVAGGLSTPKTLLLSSSLRPEPNWATASLANSSQKDAFQSCLAIL